MAIQWLLFIASVVVAYIGISWFGQMTGASSTSPLSALLTAIRPIPIIIVVVSNAFFGLGLYYGFGITRFALPATIAMGVVTSFIYSVIILGAEVTLVKLAGAAVVILGVVILAL